MSAPLNIGIDLGGRTISARTLPSATAFPSGSDVVVVVTNEGNSIVQQETSSESRLVVYYNGSLYDALYDYLQYQGLTGYKDILLPDDFGVVSEVNESAVSYPYILRSDNDKLYAFTEDMDRVELRGTAVYPDVLYDYRSPTGQSGPSVYTLSQNLFSYSHARIYYRTNDSYYSSIDICNPAEGQKVYLISGSASSSTDGKRVYLKAIAFTIAGTGLSLVSEADTAIAHRIYPSASYTAGQAVYITRVEAWN